MERRFIPVTELRVAEEDSGPVLEGYAAVFNKWADGWGFREVIRNGAFKKTIKEADIRALKNHDPNLILGRNQSGTLELREDDKGLLYNVKLDTETTYVNDLVRSIERGDITGNSFAFEVVNEQWNFEEDTDKRELLEVKLFDVGPVTYPFYEQTSLSLRSLPRNEIDFEALNGLLFRLNHGRTLGDSDLELLDTTIKQLQRHLPSDEPEEPQPELHSEGAEEEPVSYHSLKARLRLKAKSIGV